MTSRRTEPSPSTLRHGTRTNTRWQRQPESEPAVRVNRGLAASRRAATAFEVGLATAAYLTYFLVRGMTESGAERAASNGERLVRLEQWLGIYHEATIQDLAAGHDLLVNLANWVYIWGHWPVIILVGSWLLWVSPPEYRKLRNSFLISGAIGLIIFATFPVSPPRLLEIGLVDTVTERSVSYRVLQPPAFVNQYAAMPSLHFGWDLLVGISLVRHGRARWVRIVGLLLPLAMGWAVVATANHFLLDEMAGGALALFGLAVASRAGDRLDSLQLRIEELFAAPLTIHRREPE